MVATFGIGCGVPVEQIEDVLDIPYHDLFGATETLPIQGLNGIWRLVEKYAPSTRASVVDMANQMPMGVFGNTFEGAQYTPTLRDAMRFISRYSSLMAEGVFFQLDESTRYASISLSHPSDTVLNGHANQSTLCLIWRLLCTFAEESITPIGVHYMHGWSGDRAGYEDFFAADVRFDTPNPHSTIIFDRSVLDRRLKSTDASSYERCAVRADKRVERLQGGPLDPALEQLRQAVSNNAAEGIFSASAAASSANMGERTAQRVAASHGTSLQEIIQAERARIARSLLMSDPDAQLHDLAVDVGYSDERAFRRAFKQWTGISPHQFKNLITRR